ncbi:MAG: 4-hydroxy-tetrahydrodipicolinate reductase [Sorangium cellulosum]|nr:MAG: 4-hydroxy-tetrahydrodipicolinate reductase [Sorangium cellulosum]
MSLSKPKIALHGASGRMGAAMLALCREAHIPIVGAIVHPHAPEVGQDLGEAHGTSTYGVAICGDASTGLLGADVVVDFSHASAFLGLARAARKNQVPVVTGTTGLDDEAIAALDALASVVPVLWASNFSLGIQVLVEVARHAVKRLGPGFDVELVDVHHRRKADAPSGTAARLVREVQDVRGGLEPCYGRQGLVGQRPDEQLGVMALRGGDVIGDHTLHLLGPGERLELTHRATSREVFARGALLAAQSLPGRPPGRLSLADILL